MLFKIKLPNAVKFFLILFLLFWCFTWNIPTDYDLSGEGHYASCGSPNFKNDINHGNDIFSIKSGFSNEDQNYETWLHESRNLEKTVSISNAIIPSFEEWRKMEMAKHERNFEKDKNFYQHRKLTRRKLNYASSKCGAKILVSNPEARHRMAILSEKSDEYFLNPCRVKTWFVIELCDAVEVIEVELANYELYSSSPKEFSVFSSEVYPSYLWNHLGTFIAEDKRTMQTFDIRKQSMGKFIKVIIHSHHGKEHYCPLSVIRVLGYSMVPTLDIENDENRKDSDLNFEPEPEEKSVPPLRKQYQQFNETEILITLSENKNKKRICEKLFLHCSYVFKVNVDHACLYKPVCRYLEEIVDMLKISCQDFYCPRYPQLFLTNFNYICDSIRRKDSSNVLLVEAENANSNMNNNLDVKDIIKDYEHKKLLRIKKESSVHAFFGLKDKFVKSNDKTESYYIADLVPYFCKNVLHSARSKKVCDHITRLLKNSDTCKKGGKCREMQVTTKENILPEVKRIGDDIDSAGLISKESVLYKLAAKIKTSETDLNLINKYLQQLSQSYRYQIEDMKIKFNTTFKAMVEKSEKATEVNVKQEEKISVLKEKIDVLNKKISFLMKGKNEMTKKVIELHGFFLFLEIIIIATVFNIFMNIFNKKNGSNDTFRMKYYSNH